MAFLKSSDGGVDAGTLLCVIYTKFPMPADISYATIVVL